MPMTLFFFCLVVFWLAIVGGQEIAGYLPDYRTYIDVNNTAPFLTDLILFSLAPHSRGMLGGCCLEENHFRQAREAQAYKETRLGQKLRIWVAIGGGGRTDSFKVVAADPKRRERLVNSLKKLCEKEGLDGVDIDCYAPSNMSELEDYINFLREVSAVFRPAGILLSVALHQQQYLPADVFELIDRVRIMTYDMPGEPRDNYAAMEKLQNAVQGFIDNHCPPQKIVVGIPAYARHSKNPQMVKTYAEIFDEMKPTSEDMLEKQPWNGYSYDSPNEVRRKVEYAVEKGLAGVFFWELGQDKQDATFGPGGILLGAASSRMLELTAESAKAPSPVKDDGLSNEL